MAQHDYDIANQSHTAFRADLNNALAAIVSANSAATEPTTMYAFQMWADTTTGLLKIRNAANSAWIEVGTLVEKNLALTSDCAFYAYATSTQTINDATATQVTLAAESFDTASAFAGSAFTVPVTGKYWLFGRTSIGGMTDTDFGQLSLYNGSTPTVIGDSVGQSGATGALRPQVGGLFNLTAGNVMALYAYHDSTGTKGLVPGAAATYFMGFHVPVQ